MTSWRNLLENHREDADSRMILHIYFTVSQLQTYDCLEELHEELLDNDWPLNSQESNDRRDLIIEMLSSRGPNVTAEDERRPTRRDLITIRVESYFVAAGFGEICEEKNWILPKP